ncbi:MAG: ammonia-forming cytochrome c nitrite reductase subunit c552 [Neofamilia sp.]
MRRKLFIILLIIVMIMTTLVGCTKKNEAVITAKEWEKQYGNVYQTYMKNSEMVATAYGGSVPVNYLEKFPFLNTLYDGNVFSAEYLRARGHTFGIEDVINTDRPQAGASCLACKTAEFVTLLEEKGVEANSMPFDEVARMDMEAISCYDCHKNEPGTINLTRKHLTTAIEGQEHPDGNLVCAQCHVEYYLSKDALEVKLPLAHGFHPKEMLAYYNEIEFADWTHPRAGSNLLKAQHPEFETLQGSIHNKAGATCITCHMPSTEVGGENIKSHHWTSPLIATMDKSCMKCHAGETEDELRARVEGLQEGILNKTNECGEQLVVLIETLEAAINSGASEESLKAAQELHREAQFYFDFVLVENSEGFHNNKLANELLNESLKLTNEAIALLN